jgi:hypothetical protein
MSVFALKEGRILPIPNLGQRLLGTLSGERLLGNTAISISVVGDESVRRFDHPSPR